MNRTSAIFLVLTASALIVAAPYVARSAKQDRENEQASAQSPSLSKSASAGEPRGFANADFISPVAPYPWDAQRDKIERPYHLLIRVIRFDDLSPLDVGVGTVKVLGAKQVERLSPGTYLASGLDVAITQVTIKNSLRTRPDQPPQTPDLAIRNPVAMARHAITTCEVIAVLPENFEDPVEVRGVVYDRFTAETIEGAQVVTYGKTAVAITDEHGRFAFSEPLTVLQAFSLTLLAPGYRPFPVNPRSLTRTWLEKWRATGDMTLTMASEKEHREYRPLLGGGD